jgi:hypothetical protein
MENNKLRIRLIFAIYFGTSSEFFAKVCKLSLFLSSQSRWHRCRRRRFLFFILTVQLECHQVTLRINRWRVRRCAEFKEIATKMLTEKSSSIIITSNCIYIYLSDDSTNWLHQWAVFLSSILKRVRVIEWCTRRRCSDSRETSTLTFELRRSPTHYSIYIE